MKIIKNYFVALIFLALPLNANSEGSENIKKFIKGNLSEKTAAVKNADSTEAEYLAKQAITFSIQNKEFLGNDRELAALAVSGILAIPQNYVESLSEKEKNELSYDFWLVYNSFDDETVKIAVLNRIAKLDIPVEKFKETLNSYITDCNPETESHALLAAAIQTLGTVGDSNSFKILFSCAQNKNWAAYSEEIELAIGSLSEKSENEILVYIGTGNTAECRKIFDLVTKNKKNSQNLCAKISENTLVRTIYIYENTSSASDELIQLQFDSFLVLSSLKWTRASETAIHYFDVAKKEYENKQLNETSFITVIEEIAKTSPIQAVGKLSEYLSSLNKKMESNSSEISEPVVLATIKTLGAIGDKNAFDSLLAVTYYNYSETVIATARDALAKLKW